MEAITICLAFRLTARDGAVIAGWSMEFGIDLQSDVIVVSRGQQLTGTAPSGRQGLSWGTKYAWIAANAFGLPVATDGFNEAGLSFGALYFAAFADYQPVPAGQEQRAMGSWEFGGWALSNFASVAEVRAALDSVLVANTVQPQFGFVPPLHFILHDASGDCAVIEHTKGQRIVFDNPLTLMTNDPTFDWHLMNLRNYINLSVNNRQPLDIAGLVLAPLSEGTGLLGLPGDWVAVTLCARDRPDPGRRSAGGCRAGGEHRPPPPKRLRHPPRGNSAGPAGWQCGGRDHRVDRCEGPHQQGPLFPDVRQPDAAEGGLPATGYERGPREDDLYGR